MQSGTAPATAPFTVIPLAILTWRPTRQAGIITSAPRGFRFGSICADSLALPSACWIRSRERLSSAALVGVGGGATVQLVLHSAWTWTSATLSRIPDSRRLAAGIALMYRTATEYVPSRF